MVKMEKRENEVKETARLRMSERVVLLTLRAANVKVVDEATMIKELKTGRMGERTGARHLI